MTQAVYDAVAFGLIKQAAEIELSKRPGYTRGDIDVLANFKRAGQTAHITTKQAWVVFFMKHVDAIVTHMGQPDLPVSEEMSGRFADAINYLKLGYAIMRDEDAPVVPRDKHVVTIAAGGA